VIGHDRHRSVGLGGWWGGSGAAAGGGLGVQVGRPV
jgi:hypothetical protein